MSTEISAKELAQETQELFQEYKDYIERGEGLRGQKSKTKKAERELLDAVLSSYEQLYKKSIDLEDAKLKQETIDEIIRFQTTINSFRDSDLFNKNTKLTLKTDTKRGDRFDRIKSVETVGKGKVEKDIEKLEKDEEGEKKQEEEMKREEMKEEEKEVEKILSEMVEEVEMKQEEKEEMKQEEKEEMKQEEKEEMKAEEMKAEEPILNKEMEEIHNQIRKEEREKTLKEFRIGEFSEEDKIQIPKERLGVVGKTIAILNDDIKYFIKRFPDILKTEADVYKKANKRNKKLLLDIHKRIQAKLSNSMENDTQGKRIGIVLDADSYINSKINELLASKTLEGLTPANLVDITKAPTSKGKDLGSYTVIKKGGVDFIENAPIYRAIPSSNEEQAMKEEQGGKGKIAQSTIYKNSGKTKVDIAKMELRDNPFIKTRKTRRLDIIL